MLPPASLSFEGQATKQATVKWSILHLLQVCAESVIVVWRISSEGVSTGYESVWATVLFNADTRIEERQACYI